MAVVELEAERSGVPFTVTVSSLSVRGVFSFKSLKQDRRYFDVLMGAVTYSPACPYMEVILTQLPMESLFDITQWSATASHLNFESCPGSVVAGLAVNDLIVAVGGASEPTETSRSVMAPASSRLS